MTTEEFYFGPETSPVAISVANPFSFDYVTATYSYVDSSLVEQSTPVTLSADGRLEFTYSGPDGVTINQSWSSVVKYEYKFKATISMDTCQTLEYFTEQNIIEASAICCDPSYMTFTTA